MALSEHEQRMFAEIERQLVAEDPRFVARTRWTLKAWSPEVRIRLAVVLGAIGLLGMLALTFDLLFGIVGTGLVLVALLVGVGALGERSRSGERGTPPDGR